MPLNVKAIYPSENPEFVHFPSRRSVVHSTEGIVTCTQPLAARCGIKVLDAGGNAADAAVAVAAALNVTEPSSTGIGGDMFCLFYDAKTKKVSAMNGSGRTSEKSTVENIRSRLGIKDGEVGKIPLKDAHSVTVPGSAAGWVDTVERFGSGKLTLEQILTPAIELAEKGFPVSELSSQMWTDPAEGLKIASPNFAEQLKADPSAPQGYRAPRPGEVFKNPNLANTFRTLAKEGKKGFYTGPIAEAIVKVVQDRGGLLDLADLQKHLELGSEPVDPISYTFKGNDYSSTHSTYIDTPGHEKLHGVEIWEHPPNGQGLVALMTLGILEALEESGQIPTFTPAHHNTAPYLHAVIESLRIAFADASWWISDPSHSSSPIPITTLLSKPYLASRAKLFNPTTSSDKIYDKGSPAHNHSDTVYLAVTDKHGNGISFINSVFNGFGSGIIPASTGFVLQNRGANFSLEPGHPNVIAPGKRPYHTIIPAMLTNSHDGSLHSVYGVMGGFMQPQGHVQVLLNMLAFKFNPQAALDAPRFCIRAEGIPGEFGDGSKKVFLEEGMRDDVVEELKKLGHNVEVVGGFERGVFGRGQVIRCHAEDDQIIYSAGSDPRGDGAAFPG